MREQIAEIRNELMPTAEEPETEEVVEEQEEEQVEVEQETVEEAEIELFNELPEALNLDPDQFYGLKLKTDQGTTYTWSEVKDMIQDKEKGKDSYQQKLAELEAREQQLNEIAVQTNQATQTVSAEVQKAQQEIAGIEQNYAILVNQLEQYNQADDAVNASKVQAELLKLQGAYAIAQQSFQQAAMAQQRQQAEAKANHIAKQEQILQKLLPEWRDPQTREQRKEQMKSYLGDLGLATHEIRSINDSRWVAIIDKAMRWDNHLAEVKKTSKGLRDKTVRRIVRGSHPETTSRSDNAKAKIDRAKATKRTSDKKAAFRAVAQEAGLL